MAAFCGGVWLVLYFGALGKEVVNYVYILWKARAKFKLTATRTSEK